MIKSKFTINEITFFLTRNFLYHNIFHEVYNINPPIKDIIINTIDEKDDKDKEENKNVDGIKSLSLLNANIGDGINNFETILESTKTAGEEINYSFKELSENLEKFNNQLNNHD